LKNATGIIMLLCFIGAFLWYVPLVIKRLITPALATWIIGWCAITLSVISYHSILGRTVIENATLYGTAASMTITLAVIVAVLWKAGELKAAFDPIQKSCLAITCLAFVWWVFNRNQAGATFWTTQVLMIVAYAATLVKVIKRGVAFDSIGNWAFIFIGSCVGSVPSFLMESSYGISNSLRAVIASGILAACLIWYDYKAGFKGWKEEKKTLKKFYTRNK
jgi:hypothetical protein